MGLQVKNESINLDILDEVADFMGKVHNLLELLKNQETNSYSDKQAYEILYMSYKVEEFQHILESYKIKVEESTTEQNIKNSIIDNINVMLKKLEIISKSVTMLKMLLSDMTVKYYEGNKESLDNYISKFSVFNSSNKITVSKVIEEEIVIERPKVGSLSVPQVLYSSCLLGISAIVAMVVNTFMPWVLGFVDYLMMSCGFSTSFFDEAYNPGFTSMLMGKIGLGILILWGLYALKLLISLLYVKLPRLRRFIPKFLVGGVVKKAIQLYGKNIEKSYVNRTSNLVEQSMRTLKSLYNYTNTRCFDDAFKMVSKFKYNNLKCKELNIMVQIELLAEYVNRMEYNKLFFDKVDTSFVISKGTEIYKSLLLL